MVEPIRVIAPWHRNISVERGALLWRNGMASATESSGDEIGPHDERTERNVIMKSRTDQSKILRPWLRAAWRSLLLLVVGGLLGATVTGGLSAPSGKAGSTANM